jgi:putative addiction module killer protein
MFEVLTYEDDQGEKPYSNWLSKLADRQAKARVLVYVGRMAGGNFGDCKPIADGVWELRIDWGQATACITRSLANTWSCC